MRKIYCLMYLTVFLMMTGCVSFSSLQTGRTLGKNQGSFTGSLSSVTGPVLDDESVMKAPLVELNMAYGFLENLDVSAKIGLLGTSGVGVKYQFIGNRQSKLAVSGGFTMGWLSMTAGTSQNSLGDMGFPLYISYHPVNWLAVYVTPKYNLRLIDYAEWDSYSEQYVSQGTYGQNWIGMAGGVRLGRKFGFFAEYSSSKSNQLGLPYQQVSAGLTYAGFNLGKK